MSDQIPDSKKYVLVIEDDKFYGNIFQKKFTQAGYDVLVAGDGAKGLEQALARKPDMILLDLIMPNKDGFEALQQLKQHDTLKEVPVMVL